MNIAKLIENVVTEVIDFGGEKITVELAPFAYTAADAEALDFGNLDSIITYLMKGLKGWDLDWNGEDFPITEANLKTKCPEAFLVAIIERIQTIKTASMGKPTKPRK